MLPSGHMAANHHLHYGGGTNYLCLPEEPQWNNQTSVNAHTGWLYGVEYDFGGNYASFFSTTNTGGRQLHQNPVPCVVCYVPQRSTSVMIPARNRCPVGWTQEYGGYLMSDHSFLISHWNQPRGGMSYICGDQAPEIATGNKHRQQAWLEVVRVGCGMLPCSKYPNGAELACVVCTK